MGYYRPYFLFLYFALYITLKISHFSFYIYCCVTVQLTLIKYVNIKTNKFIKDIRKVLQLLVDKKMIVLFEKFYLHFLKISSIVTFEFVSYVKGTMWCFSLRSTLKFLIFNIDMGYVLLIENMWPFHDFVCSSFFTTLVPQQLEIQSLSVSVSLPTVTCD